MLSLRSLLGPFSIICSAACGELIPPELSVGTQTESLLSDSLYGEQAELAWKVSSNGVVTTTNGTPAFPLAMHADTSRVVLTLQLPTSATNVSVERCVLTNVLDPSVAPRVGPSTDLASRKAACPAVSVAQVGYREFELTMNARSMLTALGTDVNENAIAAQLDLLIEDKHVLEERRFSLETPHGVLHLIDQHPIVMLPGVGGTALWTQESRFTRLLDRLGCNVPTWPNISSLWRLTMSPEGVPLQPPTWFKALPERRGAECLFGPQWNSPLDVNALGALAENECPNCLKLALEQPSRFFGLKRQKRLWHYPLYLYPYDWRLKHDVIVDALFAPPGDPANLARDTAYMTGAYLNEPAYNRPWALRELLDFLKTTPEFQFSRDKFALAGHSNGGLVVHNAIRRKEAPGIIDAAFSLNAPYLGSHRLFQSMFAVHDSTPTAAERTNETFLDLVGDIVNAGASSVFALLGNLPVFYALAPTRSPLGAPIIDSIALSDGTVLDAATTTDGSDFFPRLANDLAKLHPGRPIEQFVWNEPLAEEARRSRYVLLAQPIRVDNFTIFYSRERNALGEILTDTPGPASYNGVDTPTSQRLEGDGLVGLDSLRGEGVAGIDESHRYEIPPSPTDPKLTGHVWCVRNPAAWRAIISRLRRASTLH